MSDSQLKNMESATLSNGETLTWSKKDKCFVGLIKGSGSKNVFNVAIVNKGGCLAAILTTTGLVHKEGDYVEATDMHHVLLDYNQFGGSLNDSGKKMPHYSGRNGDVSVALWRSDYGATTLFMVFNDVDPVAQEDSNAFLDSTIDEEAIQQSSTFYDQAEKCGDAGRPDTSEASELEQLRESKALNG